MLDIIGFTFSLLFTDHLGVCKDCNEIHPRVAITSRINERWDAAVGAYYNSKRRVSPFAGVRLNGDLGFAEFGVVGGYAEHDAMPYGRLALKLSEEQCAFIFPILHGSQLRLGIGFEVHF